MASNQNEFAFFNNENSPSGTVSSKAYTIGGIPIIFPCKAYPSQITMMDKIIKCLNKKNNCLLESPTGSGKSLALLCSSLSWQKKIKREMEDMEAELDDHLNAYGVGIEETCPVHSKSKNAECCINTENKAWNPKSCFVSNSTEVKFTSTLFPDSKENDDTNPQDSYCNQSKSSSTKKDNNWGNVSFYEDDFEDFMPAKKYRNSSGSPQFIKLGGKDCQSIHNHRRTEKIKEELLNSPSNTKKSDRKESIKTDIDESTSHNNHCCTCNSVKKEKMKKEPSNNVLPTKLPIIYFGTRTHKQIEQIIRELKRTVYRDSKMTILSSREKTCINKEVCSADNRNEACDELLKAEGGPACNFFRNSKSISHYHPRKLSSAFDLEDFVKICKQMRACPYFGSRELLTVSDVVFCPYNYLVDPLIRSAMGIDLKGNIVIMDEAHNIEDSARSAASASFSLSNLEDGGINLDRVGRYSKTIRDSYSYFAEIFKAVSIFLKDNINSLTDNMNFESSSKIWDGNDMIAVLSHIKIGPETFQQFCHHYQKVLSEESDTEKKEIVDMDQPKLLASTLNVLKNLYQILSYMYKDSLMFIPDYRCVILKTVRANDRSFAANRYALARASQFVISLNFWCLNPAVAFSDIKDCIHSLIVASGTLSPLISFQSELGIPFQVTLEANHVISKSQIWVGTIARGPKNIPLKATYDKANQYEFQDELGDLILQVCDIIPYGVLCFLPSYTLMNTLIKRWQLTELWDRLSTKKVLFSEPKKNQDLQAVMEEFYATIKGHARGALFFAVCRGKVSEGLDFADNNARAVITVGIPFPNFKDTQVVLKKNYNNKFASQRQILSGNAWYEIQGFRAMNQALGRCIRHRNDFGALIIIDERFLTINRYPDNLSKWIRQEIKHYPVWQDAALSLTDFARKTGLKSKDCDTSCVDIDGTI